jgi:hypothetical protein
VDADGTAGVLDLLEPFQRTLGLRTSTLEGSRHINSGKFIKFARR